VSTASTRLVGNEDERGLAREAEDDVHLAERFRVLDDDDSTLVDRVEEPLALPRERDRRRRIATRVQAGHAEQRAEPRLGERTETARGGALSAEQRANELTETQARAERILPVEEEDRSRGCGRRGLCHPDRSPRCRRGRSDTS